MGMKQSRLALGCAVALSLVSADLLMQQSAVAQESRYEQWKAEQKTKREAFYDAYMKRYAEYKAKVQAAWQSEAELPTRSKFVDYSDDLSQKIVVDYELGEIRIETLVDANIEPNPQLVQQTLDRLQQQSVADTLAESELTAGIRTSNENKVLDTFAPNVTAADLASRVVEEEVVAVPVKTGATSTPATSTTASNTDAEVTDASDKRIKRYRIRLTDDNIYQRRAQQYAPAIANFSTQFEVPQDLVFAITQTESSFNPLAQSPIPAFGLMQIVPTSAGLDVNRLVFDLPNAPDEQVLFDPDSNIRMGTAYLHLLQTRYLRGITDPVSRQYCVIAAYNTGAGNVASVFHPQGKRQIGPALKVINELTPEQVYQRLFTELPYEETRNYLQKVTAVMPTYQG